eukprot:gene9557-11725_t
MPALSPTMEEGNLAKWLVKEGDTIKSGDVIAEIETDKATMEVEAVDEGVVAAVKEVGLKVPLVVRLEGTNAELGKKILNESGLAITAADDLDDA